MIQLVAFDLDGTLMGADLVISIRVRNAIARTIQSGVTVTLATGRMYSATAPFARTLNLYAPLLCYQGGWIQGLNTGILHRVSLTDASTHSHRDGKGAGWHTVLYADGLLFIDAQRLPLSYCETYLGPVRSWHLTSVLASHQQTGAVRREPGVSGDGLAAHEPFASADVMQSHANFIEVVPRNVNKGQALAWLVEMLGIPRDAVLAVGDQQNDVTMLEWAGTGVAMGNAVPAAQAVADWIAPPVAQDGAAEVLERYILRPSRG